MSLSVINRVKYSPTLYSIYSYIGNKLIRLLRLVVRPNPKLIVFNSFGGRKYDDSTRCIYEKMIQDHRFDTYKIIWAFIDPRKYNIPHGKKIKTDTFIFFINVLKARCWITNSSMTRGLSFKGKNTFYFNTWHGTPIKLMGSDINTSNTSFGLKERESNIDIMLAQGKYEANIFSRVFNIPIERFRIIGLPRNDELTDYSMKEVEKIKNELHLPDNKKVILYAPTFREYTKDDNYNCVMTPPIEIQKWEKALSSEYVLLIRAHYEVTRIMHIVDNDFVRDVSSFSNLNKLMMISDLLISDYSSIFFDYSILNKPMFCFAYDYDTYMEKRGLYFDIREELGNSSNEDEMISCLLNYNVQERIDITRTFRKHYIEEYGEATKKSLDIIYENIHQ